MEVDTLLGEALELSKSRRWEQALQAWERVREAAPRNGELWFRIAEAELALNNFEAATEALDNHDIIIRKSVRATSLRARILSASGQFEPAKDVWRAVIAAVPDNFQAWARLAEATVVLGERTAARAALRRASEIRPGDTFLARLQKRLAREDRRAMQTASQNASKAPTRELSQIAPTQPPTRDTTAPSQKSVAALTRSSITYTLEQALGLSEDENWAEAAAAWTQLLRAKPDDAALRLQSWEALHHAGRADEAEPLLVEGLKRSARTSAAFEGFIEQATDFALPNQLNRGLLEFATAPECPPALVLIAAQTMRKFGSSAMALAALDAVVGRAQPTGRIAAELSKVLFDTRDFTGLIKRFDGLLSSGPPERIDGATATICYQLGLALLSLDRRIEAATFIDRAWSVRPIGALALRAKGTLLVRTEQFEALSQIVRSAFSQVAPQSWPWQLSIRLLIDAEQVEAGEAMLRESFAALAGNTDEALRLASRTNQIELEQQLLKCIAVLETATTSQHVAASLNVLRRGEIVLAKTFADRIAIADRNQPEVTALYHQLELASSVSASIAADSEWRFQDALFHRIGELVADTPVYSQVDGPIILANTAMGAGGAERQVAVTLTGLVPKLRSGQKIKLVCTRLTEARDRQLNLPPVLAAGIEVIDLSSEESAAAVLLKDCRGLKSLFDLLGPEITEDVARFYRAFKTMRPSVVHLWQDRTSVDGGIAAVMAGVPSIVMVARSTRPRARNRFRSYLRGGYAALLGQPNVILANNSFAGARDYENWLGLQPGAVSVIHNGFDLEGMKLRAHADAVSDLRERYQLHPQLPVLGGVLRFSPVKQPLLWLNVARLAVDALPDLKLLLLGEGPLEGTVRDHAAKLGLTGRLIMPGFVDPAPHMPLMSVSLLTSVTEGLPNALLEAQAFGVPVVSTNAGGAKETMIEGVSGFVLEDATPRALAEKVIKAISDDAWREIACPTATQLALDRFSIGSMVERTLSIYQSARIAGSVR